MIIGSPFSISSIGKEDRLGTQQNKLTVNRNFEAGVPEPSKIN
jgi:hypothetical protein